MIGLSFQERMAGSLQPGDGAASSPFEFTVRARTPYAWYMATGGPLHLEGHVELTGSTRRPCRGTLDLDPWRGRKLVYELYWRDNDDRPTRFYGDKDLRGLDPIGSMTTLRGKVYRRGEMLGSATLRFDLRSLPAFLLSFRPRLGAA